MANKQLSSIIITGDENTYEVYDETARSMAQLAESTATQAQTTANSKLKTVSLQSSYADESKTLTLNLISSMH